MTDLNTMTIDFLGAAIKCWECNSKYDHRCGDTFNNYSVALVDCDQVRGHQDTLQNYVYHLKICFSLQRSSEVQHLLSEGEEPRKANLCRKTMQLGEYIRIDIITIGYGPLPCFNQNKVTPALPLL